MAFPFPLNPTDGQVATQTQADGTVLKATYSQAKNEWYVERVLPAPPSLTLASGTPYTVNPPTANGVVLTWDKALGQWVGKTPTAAAGGSGGTYSKGKVSDPDTPNPPDPAKPTDMLKPGMLQTTLENLHKELRAWDGTAWQKVLTEDDIKQWIAAGSLFRSTLQAAGISALPAAATSNRGYYWTWAGASGYVVKAGDTPLAPGLVGSVLNPGDWLQSDGTKYVHVSGDLLSKQRWLSLGGFQPWSDTSWESGSIVSYQKAFWRSTTNIVAGDAPPGDGSAGNKWQDITPLPHMGLEDLKKVNAAVANPGVHGEVFQWDANIQEWVSSDTLQIGAVRFDDIGIGPEITGFASADFSDAGTDDDSYVPSVYAVKEYVAAQPKPFLEELDDCGELAKADDGQVPVWVAANSRWEPKFLSSPIIYLGNGAWTAADVADKTKNYGMPAGTVPDPQQWTPQPGDQYIDTATGDITVFTGAGGTNPAPPPGRNDPTDVTGGTSSQDIKFENLADLLDTIITAPADGQILQWKTDHWENVAANFLTPTNGYTKTEVDNKISALVIGIEHQEAVLDRVDTPPAAPAQYDLYIVGPTPTGAWTGQANNLAEWDGAAWQFVAPKANESHLVEKLAETWHWNGTAWVKVAVASTTSATAASAAELWVVGSIQQSWLTETQWASALGVAEAKKWVLADGRNVAGSRFETLTGQQTVPDLRGAFFRAAGTNHSPGWEGGAVRSWHDDSTKRPNNAFTTDTQGNHYHGWTDQTWGFDSGGKLGILGGATNTPWGRTTGWAGDHTHTITGGGDAETAPKHFSLNTFIKID